LTASALAVVSVPTAYAKKHETRLYPISVDYHFVDAKGKAHQMTVTVNIDDQHMDQCSGFTSAGIAMAEAEQRHPELAAMTYTGATCHGPHGSQSVTASAPATRPTLGHDLPAPHPAPPSKPYDPYGAMAHTGVANPAAVQLTYRLITHAVKTWTVAPKFGNQALDMSTCPQRLPGLLGGMEQSVKYGYGFPGGTLLSAKCVPLGTPAP